MLKLRLKQGMCSAQNVILAGILLFCNVTQRINVFITILYVEIKCQLDATEVFIAKE